jgi:hypothetical protein
MATSPEIVHQTDSPALICHLLYQQTSYGTKRNCAHSYRYSLLLFDAFAAVCGGVRVNNLWKFSDKAEAL